MTKVRTGAPLDLITGDTETANHPRDDYAANFTAINTAVDTLQDADAGVPGAISTAAANTLQTATARAVAMALALGA